MNSTMQKLEFVELDAMDAPSDQNDWTRGVALGILIGIIALT